MNNYIIQSLELHLFFSRIMKEHSLFLESGFIIKDQVQIKKARCFRIQFEEFLREVVMCSDGIVSGEVLESGEVVTQYTMFAEGRTSQLTGIPIDGRITAMEQKLRGGCPREDMNHLQGKVRCLNQRALQLLDGLITFKQNVLDDVKRCQLFTANYPLLIEHIIREAKLYCSFVCELENTKMICTRNMMEVETFWNQIMMEHALFIRGLLDPTETVLITAADGFAKEYAALLEESNIKNCSTMQEITRKTMDETVRYRDFKAAGTKGIIGCEIASIILPLLADHVLREANHYLRLLNE